MRNDALKQTLCRLADSVAELDLTDRERLLRAFRLAPQHVRAPSAREAADERVGIWSRPAGSSDQPFVRIHSGGERLDDWADVESIGVQKNHWKRVVLFGESVARGYFLDPAFTPARELERVLMTRSGKEVDVIDLARTDLLASHLERLVHSADVLEPDAVVVFAGNNWHPSMEAPGVVEDALTQALVNGLEWHHVIDSIDTAVQTVVWDTLRTMLDSVRRRSCEFIFVLPAFNLADWVCTEYEPLAVSPEGMREWNRLRVAGEAALSRGEPGVACEVGNRLSEIDGGSAGVGFRLAGVAHYRLGHHAEAQRLLSKARDVGLLHHTPDVPRCYGSIRDAVHAASRHYGFDVVDVEDVAKKSMGVALPDRTVFYDYCHMTPEAIHFVMDSVASLLCNKWSAAAPATDLPIVPSRTRSEAHFMAAVHNANWGQSDSIVRYHYERAVQEWSGIESAMLAHADFAVRRQPADLCSTFSALRDSSSAPVRRFFRGAGWSDGDKPLNPGMLAAVRAVCPQEYGRIDRVLVTEQAIAEECDSDLLRRQRWAVGWGASDGSSDNGVFSALKSTSRFTMAIRDPRRLIIKACLRLPCSTGEIAFHLNGFGVAVTVPRRRWTTVYLDVPAAATPPGLNYLDIMWPDRHWEEEEWHQLMARRGLAYPRVPPWGQLSHLTARQCPTDVPSGALELTHSAGTHSLQSVP